MNKTLYIMRGLPGSGKSTQARKLKSSCTTDSHVCALFSTDDYWLRPDGTYDFNYDLITEGHKWNQGRVEKAMCGFTKNIIVDNVNTNYAQVKPYALLAKKYGYKVVIVDPVTDWCMDVEKLFAKNKHGVPYSTILRMYHEWESKVSIEIKLKALGVKV